MKTTKNIARLAVTAGLTAVLSFGGVMAPVTMAFAADAAAAAADGSVKIANVQNNHTEFDGYQIFKADVATVEGKTVASNIAWANGGVKNAVEGVIKTADESYAGTTAQDAADWITNKVTGTNDTYRVGPDDIAYKIAAAVDDLTDKKTTTDGAVSGLEHGYWLFVTKADTINEGEAGTSPIFTVVGSAPVQITEKTGIPTVEKKIKDDKPGSEWADKADSQVGQDVQYQLTGTVADNVASYNTYCYEFHDKLSAGLTANDSSIRVYAGNDRASAVEITSEFTHEVKDGENGDGQTLTVKFTDLKKAVTGLLPSTKVFVEYTARLDPGKAVVVGGTGNDNTVKLIYSNNPMSEGKGESVPDTVRDYTYALEIIKQDADNEAAKIDGVKFTIQATDPDDTGSKDKYVNDKGVLVDSPYEFVTANGGKINVKGLDAGTYTVHEVEDSNPGYNTLPNFTFTIKAEGLNKDEGTSLDEHAAANTLKVTAQQNDSALVTPSVDNGTVTLTVKNKKGSNLPLTGLNGVTFTWIAGGAVLCIGVTHLIRSRKRDEGSEE